MSTTIDQRVVEMQFDNKQFEREVATSMSTLEKLKQKLNFSGASKGLDELNNSTKKLDFSNVSRSVDQVGLKFNGLYTIADQAFRNMYNSAEQYAKKIVSAFTIDPVKTGLSEYETKMNAVQVIKANTRSKYDNDAEQMQAITSALEELNQYADRTIYNFIQMTDNVGKFVAQGLDVDEAAKAVQGLANLAGASGASASDMARATYQMSQALGGTIRKIDWNSLRNANMATVELKNTLMDLARVNNIAIDDMIKKHGTFEDTLSEGWLTGAMFTEAMNIYSDVYSEAELRAKGFNDDQIKNFKELAKMAQEATTEVKTFTQLWDVLKETAQSGWTQTWEIIIGDFGTAKAMFTDLQNYFSEIINKLSAARNFLVEGALNIAKPWKTMMGKLEDSGLGKIKKVTDSIGNITHTLEEYQKVVREIWRGNWGRSDTGRFEKLDAAGWDHRVVQDLVNKGAKYKLTVEDIEASHKKFGLSMEKSAKTTEQTAEATDKVIDALGNLRDEQLKSAGFTEEEIKLYHDLAEEADRTGVSIGELVDKMSTRDGRTLAIESIKNVWSGFVGILKAVAEAWTNVFPPMSVVRLYNIIDAIHKFTSNLTEANIPVDELRRTFEGLFAVLDIIATIASGTIRIAFKTVTKILGYFGTDVINVTAKIGDALVKFRDNVDKAIDGVSTFVAEHVSKWIEQLKESEFVQTCAGWFDSASKTISGALDNITERIDGFSTSNFVKKLDEVSSVISSFATSLANSETFMSIIDGICGAFKKLWGLISKFKLPEFNIDNLLNFSKTASTFDGTVIGGFFGGLTKLKDYFLGIGSFNWETFKNKALESFVNFWLKVGDKVKKAFEVCKDIALSIKEFIFGTEEVNLPTILGVVEKFLAIALIMKALTVLNTVISPLDNVTDALNNFATSLKWDAMSSAFKSMAIAIGVFTVCIALLANMPDMNKAWHAAGMIIALMVVMGATVSAMAFFASKIDGGVNVAGAAGALLMMVASIALLVHTIKAIDKLDLNNTGRTFLILAGILVTLTAGVSMISKAAGSSFKSVAAILTLMAALKLILDIIVAYDEFDWTGKSRAIDKMLQMMLALSMAIRIASGGTKAGASSSGLALTLIAMVLSLKVLLGVIEDFAAMPTDTIVKGGLVVTALLGLMTWMMVKISSANKGQVLEKGQKSVNNFVGLATALLAVVAAVWLLGNMDINTLVQGGVAVSAILLLFTGMIAAMGKVGQGFNFFTITTMLVGVGLLMAEMSYIIERMQTIPWQSALSSAGALAALLITMALVLRTISMNDVKAGELLKWIGAMTALSGVLAILAFVLDSIKDISPANAIGNAIALGVMLAEMAGVLHILSALDMRKLSTKKMGKLVLTFVGLTAVLAMLAPVLALMSTLDVTGAIPNALALGILLNAMSAAIFILSESKSMNWKKMGTVLISMTVLTAILYALSGVLHLLKTIDPINAIGNFTALSLMLGAMSAAILILSNSKAMNWQKMGTTLIAMTALSAIMYALAGVLYVLKSIDPLGAIGNAIALGVLLNAMASAMLILSYANPIATPALVGLGAMVIIVGLVAVVLGVLSQMNCELSITAAMSLSVLLVTMAGIYTILGVTGGLAATAVAGAIGMIEVIALLGAAVLLIGGFMSLFKAETIQAWKTGLENFMDFLVILAEGLGSIVGGFFAGFTDGLVDVGEDLKSFAESISGINPDAFTGMKALCDALSTLTTATFWNAINDAIFGDGSLSTFGESIKGFATCIKDAAESLKNITDDDVANITRAATAGGALAELGQSIPSQGGWAQTVLGSKDLATFGESIVAFADCLVNYSAKVAGDKIDAEAITASATAGQAISDLNGAIPAQGGWAQTVMGAKDLATFGASIVAFADCLVKYSNKVSETTFNTEAITASAKAAEALADLNGKLPSQNGLYQAVMGEKNLGEFGTQLISFASGVVSYANAASQIDDAKITAITNSGKAIDELVAVVEKIPSSGGWGEAIFGSSDGQSFGVALSSVATGIASYCETAATIGDDDITAIQNSKTAITELGSVLSATPEKSDNEKAGTLLTAVNNLKSVASTINDLTVAGYDYSGLFNLRLKIADLRGMFTDFDTKKLGTDFYNICVAVSNAVTCADRLVKLNDKTYEGVGKLKAALSSLSGADVDGVVDAFSGKADNMSSAIQTLTTAMSSGLKSGGESVSATMTALVSKVIKAAKDKAEEFKTAGMSFATNLANGIKNEGESVATAAKSAATKAASGARTKYSGMYTAGQYLGEGLVNGIENKWDDAYRAGYTLGAMAVQGEKDGQQSQSPSKATIQAGKWLGEGLIIGIDRMGSSVYKAGKSIGMNAINSISGSISRISNFVETGIDAQPTIRPVLDLSDVRAGAGAISSMFGNGTTLGVSANVGAISSMMNARSQNGVNGDIVSAIDKLRKDIGNMDRTTYQINGVTYDDGSNVASAIGEIARYARIERRV